MHHLGDKIRQGAKALPGIMLGLLILTSAGSAARAETGNATLSGAYRMFEFGVDDNLTRWWSAQADVTFDGGGDAAYQPISDSRGLPAGGTRTYSIDADGVLHYAGTETGMAAQAGDFFVLVDADASDGSISHTLGIKKSSGQTDASLQGDYIMHHFGARIGVDNYAQRFAMYFDGSGGGSWEILADSRGQSGGGPSSYSIGEDGALILPSSSTGYISPDANLFVASVTSASSPSLARSLGVKKSSGRDDSALNGVYLTHELFVTDNLVNKRTTRREMTFDGAGGVTYQIIEDSLGDSGGGQTSYSVDGQGVVSYGDGLYTGMVSPNGQVLVLIDSDPADGSLGVIVAVKKTALE